MLIQILGTGCAKCSKLAAVAEEAAQKANIAYTLEKVTDIDKILSFGIMMTPALVVNGKVKCIGRVPTVEQIIALFD
jgi:small redox-active disulfide protein 2